MFFDLNENDVLSKVQVYELYRPDEDARIFIHVSQMIYGSPYKFIAIPQALSEASQELWGSGDSEEEALGDCLSKIKSRKIRGYIIKNLAS